MRQQILIAFKCRYWAHLHESLRLIKILVRPIHIFTPTYFIKSVSWTRRWNRNFALKPYPNTLKSESRKHSRGRRTKEVRAWYILRPWNDQFTWSCSLNTLSILQSIFSKQLYEYFSIWSVYQRLWNHSRSASNWNCSQSF